MNQDKPQRLLSEEILNDAKSRAADIIATAKAGAEKIVNDAKRTSLAQTAGILDEHRVQAQKRAEMIKRTADQTISQNKLRARDEIVREVFNQAQTRLKNLSAAEHKALLFELALEAAREMSDGEIVVRVCGLAGKEAEFPTFAQELQEQLKEKVSPNTVKVILESSKDSGIIVESADGKIRWDNTFDARMRRLAPDLRALILPILFEEVQTR